ncbi:MAG: pilus assembly protein TadG-related protein [Ferrovum myxofaciens]
MNKSLNSRGSASPRASLLSKQRGAISVAAALSMTALMGMGAMAVDVGNVMVARNDVQNAADAAALRGAGLLYTQGSSSPDFSAMNNSPSGPVYTTANLNTPIEKQDTLTVNANYWKSFNPSAPSNDANDAAVRVTYTKQVNLFFASIIGMNSMNVTATSTAIVQNSSGLGAGGTHLPFAIPQCVINQYWGNSTDQIEVGPTHTCSSTCVTAQLTHV